MLTSFLVSMLGMYFQERILIFQKYVVGCIYLPQKMYKIDDNTCSLAVVKNTLVLD